MPKISIVDWVSAGILLLAMLQGVIRGLARELGRLITVAVALTLGLLYYSRSALFLQTHSSLPESKAAAIAFAALVLGAMLAIFVGRLLIGKVATMKLDIKGNKPGGLLAGFLSAAGVVFAVFFAVNLWPGEALHRRFCTESLLGSALVRVMPSPPDYAGPSSGAKSADLDGVVDEPPPIHPVRHK